MTSLLDTLHSMDTTPEIFFGKLRIGISLVDAHDGTILFANEAFANILGCPYELLASNQISFLELTHPDDRERNSNLQKRLLCGEVDHYQLEKRYLRHDGSVIWANVSVDAVRRSEQIIWSIALIEDITALKILEQQLEAATAVGRLATWTWDVRSDTSTVSPAYYSLHHLPDPASGPGPSLSEVMRHVHPEDRERFQTAVLRGVTNRTGHTEEYRTIQADGEIRWFRATATCLYDAAGEVTHLIGATIDITDAKTHQPPKNVSLPIRNILRHIEQRWSESISLIELGKLYGISPRSIHNHFAAEGTTPNRHIKQVRLRHARQMLQSALAGTTVTAVAVQCGFSNLGHFAKDYRQEFGEAPSDTMKANK